MEEVDGKLIPILREGIDVIKMIFFKKLKDRLAINHPASDGPFVGRLAGAIVNDLFGSPNPEAQFVIFAKQNQSIIDAEMNRLSENFEEMRIPLTDALRMQFLCDHQEGVDSASVLARAKDLHILMVEREVPLPASFLNLVRKLGGSFNILAAQQPPI
ncbi:MAG: hypothetical protein AB7W37_17525 [Syntrophobacteraceae bacterium]